MERAQPVAGTASRRLSTLTPLAIAQFVDCGEGQIANSFFPAIREALGLNTGALGVIVVARKVIQIVGAPFWGYLSDRFTRKAVLVWGTGAWGLWTLLTGLAQNYAQLLILASIAAFGITALEGALRSSVSDLFSVQERGRAFGIIRA